MKKSISLTVAMVLLCSALLLTGCTSTKSDWSQQYVAGNLQLNNGEYEEAIGTLTIAIELDPQKPEAYAGRAEAYAATGNHAAALTDYQSIMRISPTFVLDPALFPYLNKLLPYFQEGKLPPAQEDFSDMGDIELSLTGNYWWLTCGASLGSNYYLAFNADGTYDSIGVGSGMTGFGTYRYENDVLTLDCGGIPSMYTETADFTWAEDGFLSIDGYDAMDVDFIHYTIEVISREQWVTAHFPSNPSELIHFWRASSSSDYGNHVWDIHFGESGQVAIGLGEPYSEYLSRYEGQWYLRRKEGDMYVIDLLVVGGDHGDIDSDTPIPNASDYTLTIGLWLENGQICMQKISGDDIYIGYDLWHSQENYSLLG